MLRWRRRAADGWLGIPVGLIAARAPMEGATNMRNWLAFRRQMPCLCRAHAWAAGRHRWPRWRKWGRTALARRAAMSRFFRKLRIKTLVSRHIVWFAVAASLVAFFMVRTAGGDFERTVLLDTVLTLACAFVLERWIPYKPQSGTVRGAT